MFTSVYPACGAEFELGRRALNKEEIAKLITLEQVVEFVEILFDYQLPEGILYETLNEKKLIKAYRYFYKGVRMWLEHLVLRKRLDIEAITTNWQYFQPHAQIDAAHLELITGVQPRSFLADCFDSPLHMWGSFMVNECKQTISESGLLDGVPVIRGKAEIVSYNLERLKLFDEREFTFIPPANHRVSKITLLWHKSPRDYLNALASDIAEKDPDFDQEYWIPYQKAISRWERKLRDCNKLQAGHLLPNGELFITGKGQKIPKQFKDIKGFGCNSR